MEDLRVIMAEKILNFRAANNYTQQELAKKLKTSNKTISSIENQDGKIALITLLKLQMRLQDLEEGEK